MPLDELKGYLRVDGDCDDMLVGSLKLAAEEYLLNAGIKKDYTRNLYVLAVQMLVANWYENRQMTDKELKEVPYGIKCIIHQLQF